MIQAIVLNVCQVLIPESLPRFTVDDVFMNLRRNIAQLIESHIIDEKIGGSVLEVAAANLPSQATKSKNVEFLARRFSHGRGIRQEVRQEPPGDRLMARSACVRNRVVLRHSQNTVHLMRLSGRDAAGRRLLISFEQIFVERRHFSIRCTR